VVFRPDQYPPKGWNDIPGRFDDTRSRDIAKITDFFQKGLVDVPHRLAHSAINIKNCTKKVARRFLDLARSQQTTKRK
jgi:hypothetical protein